MTHERPTTDEIDITEAMQITGKSRETLMRWKKAGKLTARTEEREYLQRQRRVLFRRSEVESLARADDIGRGAPPSTAPARN